MGQQVVTRGPKFKLHRDLRGVAKRTHKFPGKCTEAPQKTF